VPVLKNGLFCNGKKEGGKISHKAPIEKRSPLAADEISKRASFTMSGREKESENGSGGLVGGKGRGLPTLTFLTTKQGGGLFGTERHYI